MYIPFVISKYMFPLWNGSSAVLEKWVPESIPSKKLKMEQVSIFWDMVSRWQKVPFERLVTSLKETRVSRCHSQPLFPRTRNSARRGEKTGKIRIAKDSTSKKKSFLFALAKNGKKHCLCSKTLYWADKKVWTQKRKNWGKRHSIIHGS